MYIQVQAGDEQVATYEFLLSSLEEAVKKMDLAKPIALDRFLLRNSAFPTHVIPEVHEDDTLTLTLSFDEDEASKFQPKLAYCTGINLTKYMSVINWSEYFSLDGSPVPPSDTITLYPIADNTCSVKVRSSLSTDLPPIYIAYGARISLNMIEQEGENAKDILFKMDPLVKVSSNQGG